MSNQSQSAAAMSAAKKLARVQELLGRMQELAEQVASGKYAPEECAAFQAELLELCAEIEHIADTQA